MSEPTAQPNGVSCETWDTAHEVLLAIIRDQANISRIAKAMEQLKIGWISNFAHERAQWDAMLTSCGHIRKYRELMPGKTGAEFVEDPEANGVCVICRALKEASHLPMFPTAPGASEPLVGFEEVKLPKVPVSSFAEFLS